MYKTEPHLHTSEVSLCGKISAEEMIKLYSKAGFSTVFVTDHFTEKTLNSFGEISWNDCIDRFMLGYKTAKKSGESLGVNVLFAAEFSFKGAPNDYLVYGIDEEFLKKHEGIHKIGIENLYKLARENHFLIIQAHPYRNNTCYPTVEYIDGIEIINTNPRHENHDDKVMECSEKYNHLYRTAGSDAHQYTDIAKCGIITQNEIKTTEDYISAIKSGNYELYKEELI